MRFGSHDEISLGYKGNMKRTIEMTKTKIKLDRKWNELPNPRNYHLLWTFLKSKTWSYVMSCRFRKAHSVDTQHANLILLTFSFSADLFVFNKIYSFEKSSDFSRNSFSKIKKCIESMKVASKTDPKQVVLSEVFLVWFFDCHSHFMPNDWIRLHV